MQLRRQSAEDSAEQPEDNGKLRLCRLAVLFAIGFAAPFLSFALYMLVAFTIGESVFALIGIIFLAIPLCIPLIGAMRYEWWDFIAAFAYTSGLSVPLFIITMDKYNPDIRVLIVLFVVLLIPWAIGRFIRWCGQPHQ